MRVRLIKRFYMEAAHYNKQASGIAARLHGHSYKIEIVAAGEVDPKLGWLIDYGDLKKCFQPLYEQLDHHYLNEIEGIEDGSLESLRTWIKDRLAPILPSFEDVYVSIVGDNAFRPVELKPDIERGLPRRIRFTFEAAQTLPNLPEGHPCRRLHGHSYRVEIGAEDLGSLMPRLRELHSELDHRCFSDIPNLEEATSERLCAWIWKRLARHQDDLRVVVVQETATARCIYYGK